MADETIDEITLTSDGHPVTAHDFEFAWKRQLCPANDSANNELFYDIKNAKAW